jgi:sugar phosphate isomerase/epimerase
VVIDAANLFHPADLAHIPAVLQNAFDLLGADIVLAHAKDLSASGEVVAAGKGVLDYDLYLRLLQKAGYSGPLILHSLAEEEVASSVAFLWVKLNQLNNVSPGVRSCNVVPEIVA